MSTWTVGDEEQYIIKVLKRYDPKVESLVERCHHARLYAIGDAPTEATGDRDKPLAQGAVFVVKRHGRSIYNIMLFNRKASTDANQETLNVWIAGVPLGPSAKLEMKGANMFIHCPRSDKDFRLHFTENVDVQRMTDFCRSCTSSNLGDLRSLLSMSGGSGQLLRSLDETEDILKVPSVSMEWSWLGESEDRPWKVPNLTPVSTPAPISAATAGAFSGEATPNATGTEAHQANVKTHKGQGRTKHNKQK